MSKPDTSRHAPQEIDAYLADLPDDIRAALVRVRSIVRETAPECTERVSYQIPVFRLGKDLVGLSAQRSHCALHSMSPPLMKAMSKKLKGMRIKVSGATIHFTPDKPLPKELIVKILRERIKEL